MNGRESHDFSRGRDVNRLPAPRADLGLREGYHSAQVDVEVRLNTNESPFPPPASWREEIAAGLADVSWARYPDRDAGDLREAIAANHGVRADRVFAANGSNEVLQAICLAYGGSGRRALTFEPTYALHGHVAHLTGTSVVSEGRDPDFRLGAAQVAAAFGRHDPAVGFLCSPNNPTGLVDPPEVLDAALASTTGLVVLDEAYGQFAEHSALPLVADDLPLVVVRTFSKTWALAGLRLGYAIAPAPVVRTLERVSLPYHLDAFKQLAGRLALAHGAEMQARVTALVAERGRLVDRLAGMPVTVWPSQANFVLVRPETRSGTEVWSGLVERSVLVRDTSSWPGLEGCLRVTVGTAEEDDRFLAALAEVLR